MRRLAVLIRKTRRAKARHSCGPWFPGLKPGAFSVVLLAQDRFAQGLKPAFIGDLYGTTEVMP